MFCCFVKQKSTSSSKNPYLVVRRPPPLLYFASVSWNVPYFAVLQNVLWNAFGKTFHKMDAKHLRKTLTHFTCFAVSQNSNTPFVKNPRTKLLNYNCSMVWLMNILNNSTFILLTGFTFTYEQGGVWNQMSRAKYTIKTNPVESILYLTASEGDRLWSAN